MQDAWNFLYVDIGIMIPSLIFAAAGAWLYANQNKSILKAIAGAILAAVGGLAALSAFYIDGFRWVNVVAGIVLVMFIGISLIKNAPGFATTALGGLVVVFGLFALSNTRPLDRIDYDTGSFGQAFSTGWGKLVDIFDADQRDNRPGRDRQNSQGHNQGQR